MDDSIAVFKNPHSSNSALLRAAAKISSGVPASLWNNVANNPACRAFQRSVAVFVLLQRHLTRPATLAQAAILLEGGFWLNDAQVEKVEVMGGEIPVVIPEGGSAFVIHFMKDLGADQPDIGVYLALDHDLNVSQLRRSLMLRIPDPESAKVMITDFYLFPEDLIPQLHNR